MVEIYLETKYFYLVTSVYEHLYNLRIHVDASMLSFGLEGGF